MENLLDKLLEAVELGKVDKKSLYPPQLKDQDGKSMRRSSGGRNSDCFGVDRVNQKKKEINGTHVMPLGWESALERIVIDSGLTTQYERFK